MKKKFQPTYAEFIGKMHSFYKYTSAGKRGINFELDVSDVEKIIVNNPCTYCERPPAYITLTSDKGLIRSSGIDRINNSLGYTIENCTPCCKSCNKLKSNFSIKKLAKLSNIDKKIKENGIK